MKLTSPILITKFAEHIKHKYPNLNSQQIKEICTSEFEHVKKQMSSGKLPVIRLKYFGTFMARPGRVRAVKDKLEVRYKKGNMSSEEYFTMRDNLENYVNDTENNMVPSGELQESTSKNMDGIPDTETH